MRLKRPKEWHERLQRRKSVREEKLKKQNAPELRLSRKPKENA